MFKMLEKLINEHGSANILKERLGLRDDQISLLKQEFSTLKRDNSDLLAENGKLKISLKQALEETQRLKEVIEYGAKSQSAEEFSEAEIIILKHLFENAKSFTIEEISSHLGVIPNIAQHHINTLLNNELVIDQLGIGGMVPTMYRISESGIAFVMENGNK